MSIPDPIADVDEGFPPIFGTTHSLLMKVASQAARDAAAAHIRAGRLTSSPNAEAGTDATGSAPVVLTDDLLP
jgi:hypothetical protein